MPGRSLHTCADEVSDGRRLKVLYCRYCIVGNAAEGEHLSTTALSHDMGPSAQQRRQQPPIEQSTGSINGAPTLREPLERGSRLRYRKPCALQFLLSGVRLRAIELALEIAKHMTGHPLGPGAVEKKRQHGRNPSVMLMRSDARTALVCCATLPNASDSGQTGFLSPLHSCADGQAAELGKLVVQLLPAS